MVGKGVTLGEVPGTDKPSVGVVAIHIVGNDVGSPGVLILLDELGFEVGHKDLLDQ